MRKEKECESRRSFISKIASGLAALGLASPLLARSAAARGVAPGAVLGSLKVDDYPQLQQVGGSILLKKTPEGDLLVVRSGEEKYSAFSVVCPHLQCNVKVKNPKLIQCPCHQSGYSIEGDYLSGPAKTGLRKYAVTFDAGMLTITMP